VGYWIEDDSGYLGDFASISGLKEFRVWAEGVGGAVGSFVDQGMTENPSGLADALDQQKAEGDVEDLRKELLEMARGADGALVLTDGSDGDDEEDDGQEASAGEASDAVAAEAFGLQSLGSPDQARDDHGRWTAGKTAGPWVAMRERINERRKEGMRDHLVEAGLSEDEADRVGRAVGDYAGMDFARINASLRSGRPPGHAAQAIMTFIAATQPHPTDKPVYRGQALPRNVAEGLRQGSLMTAPSFWSTTASASVASDFAARSYGARKAVVFMRITGNISGVPLGRLGQSGEREVIYPPGARFKVISVEKFRSGYKVMLKEVPSPIATRLAKVGRKKRAA